ncbi:MAG: DUF1818 family protein [Cyanobium sp.]
MQVCEGEGWRLEHDPARHPFAVLIGGGPPESAWAAEMTIEEAEALSSAVSRLLEQHASLASSLMEEEAISLELETLCAEGMLWVGLEGDRRRWSLRFLLSPSPAVRAFEGGWDRVASAAIAAALATLPLESLPPRPDSR